jgi:nucleotide-binding universal stress UspA family protein
MKILIPTDFSKLSKVAVKYAVKISKKLNAELVLLHVVYIDFPPRNAAAVRAKDIEDTLVDNATQDCIQLIDEIKKENNRKIRISYKIIKGYPVEDVIGNFAQHNDISLIIMGTKGASGLKKILMGSNATAVINHSDIPVISVPEFARFNNLKNIVYATDMTNLNSEMKVLIPLAKLFDARIHISHILSSKTKMEADTKKALSDAIKKLKYSKITLHISIHKEITEGIDECIADTKADMLAMFTHNLTFYERFFGKSVTRKMVFQSWIPLLTIKNRI